MKRIRRLAFVILLALASSSICWSQSIGSQRVSKTRDLCARWPQDNREPHHPVKSRMQRATQSSD